MTQHPSGTVARSRSPSGLWLAVGIVAVLLALGLWTPLGSVVSQTATDRTYSDVEDPGASDAPWIVLLLFVGIGVPLFFMSRSSGRRRAHGGGGSAPGRVGGSGRFRLSTARRAQILVRHLLHVGDPTSGRAGANATQFPAWASENSLIETILRIANTGASYTGGALPDGPGLYAASVQMGKPGHAPVVVKVIVDADTHDVIAAHPGAPVPHAAAANPAAGAITTAPAPDSDSSVDRLEHRVRELLDQARAALPAAAADYATVNPRHPDSVANLAYVQELLDQDECEVALCAIAEIAREVDAGSDCWWALDAAARAMSFDAEQRARASLR